MNRRPAITLVEVLAAIFITGVGLLALMTLFPLGALSMAQAVKDDRTAHLAANAQAVVHMKLNPGTGGRLVALRDDPLLSGFPNGVMFRPGLLPPITSHGRPGYPVLVDPMGVVAYRGTIFENWVAGKPGGIEPFRPRQTAIPRRTMGFLPRNSPSSQIIRWCTLLDDMNFVNDGLYQGLPCAPPEAGGGNVERQGRYSVAWFLRWASTGTPTDTIDLSILAFSGRTLEAKLGSSGGLEPAAENSYDAFFTPGSKQVSLVWDPAQQEKPNLRRGGWILDATLRFNMQGLLAEVHGWFYRVVDVADSGPNRMDLEVQSPLKGTFVGPQNRGQVVVFDNLVEVFDRGTH